VRSLTPIRVVQCPERCPEAVSGRHGTSRKFAKPPAEPDKDRSDLGDDVRSLTPIRVVL